MSLSIYDVSVPTLIRGFSILSSYVDRAETHVVQAAIDAAVLMSARLFPDMPPFSGQIQRASDNTKNGVARLAGIEPPRFADDEASFSELRERIGATVSFLQAIQPEQLAGSEERQLEFTFRSLSGTLDGRIHLMSVLTRASFSTSQQRPTFFGTMA